MPQEFLVKVLDEHPISNRLKRLGLDIEFDAHARKTLSDFFDWLAEPVEGNFEHSLLLLQKEEERLYVRSFRGMIIYFVIALDQMRAYPYGLILRDDSDYEMRCQRPRFSSRVLRWINDTDESENDEPVAYNNHESDEELGEGKSPPAEIEFRVLDNQPDFVTTPPHQPETLCEIERPLLAGDALAPSQILAGRSLAGRFLSRQRKFRGFYLANGQGQREYFYKCLYLFRAIKVGIRSVERNGALAMNQLAPLAASPALPALITVAGDQAARRFLEFFAATIRNPHTRRAYSRAVADFLAWCDDYGVTSITAVQPLHVATWIELQTRQLSAPTVKLRLAAIRHLFDWLVTGQVIAVNPAASVRGPAHSSRTGKTPVLEPAEARALLDAIDITTPAGLRDRALIALMVYSFARIGAALGMKVEDVFTQNRRLWVRLREKGGKAHAMPCHHNLETYLTAYLDQAGIGDDPKGPLFRTIGRGTGQLTRTVLPARNAYAMIGRRAAAAGIDTKLGNHSFRATGITAYLKNGGTLEKAAQMANHASTRTTQLYDRRHDEMSLDEVERIRV